MLPVPQDLLKRLKIAQAITEEAQSWQNLIPPNPGWDQFALDIPALERWLKGQLLAGLMATPDVVVAARKTAHGVRPVPVWGIAERITYRTLVNFLLRNEPPLDRSPEAYLRVISAPVRYAQTLDPLPARGRVPIRPNAAVGYVVQADITAFYDCIDHGILSRELLTRTGDYVAIECLISLLGEVQGKAFGLPQLLDPSDRLSELYIDIVERNILRRGWAAWRFNDDFRVAVPDFSKALAAIEDLANAARDVGLTLSDFKTTTPRFSTYLLRNFGLQVADEVPEDLRRLQAEETIGDYTEDFDGGDLTRGVGLISKANTPDMTGRKRSKDGIDLANIHGDGFRMIRRALGQLARAGSGEALQHMIKLLAYVPSLTPWVIRYVIAAGEDEDNWAEALKTLDQAIANISLSDWQRVWMIYALDEMNALYSDAPGDPASRRAWVLAIRDSRVGPLVVAEAALALAKIGAVGFEDLEYGLRTQPAALMPWYLAAVSRLRGRNEVTEQQYAALRNEGGLHMALLPKHS